MKPKSALAFAAVFVFLALMIVGGEDRSGLAGNVTGMVESDWEEGGSDADNAPRLAARPAGEVDQQPSGGGWGEDSGDDFWESDSDGWDDAEADQDLSGEDDGLASNGDGPARNSSDVPRGADIVERSRANMAEDIRRALN
ncbi:hypothetical protein [Alteraurantiacibacter aquimixticola]|uniref:Uncharacterized protein n=1 Tax=Alteraurantiacibacter aquimixticola TaxID=2489173 RepID=A0A4T3EZ88_9SPHN|nr:hypothetical protein [Alteraurantiacibacter aquimixticola]TIX50059.1 hypothetical protein E5222_07100 [Alteraurantiacibacter aquimixticola]